MSKWINADELKQSIDNCFICNICPDKHIFCSYDCDFPDAVTPKWEMLINAQPSIDIVRCKECKHRHTPDCFRAYLEYDIQEWVVDSGDDDDFCSYGEREGE